MLSRRTFLASPLFVAGTPSLRPALTTETLLPGSRWATDVHTIVSNAPGPTVLIMGGVHGDEPAGALAADAVLQWPIERGCLVIVPRANGPAIAARTRLIPRSAHADLARAFPRSVDDAPRGELATALWELVKRKCPDVFVDLHEGFGVHRRSKSTIGSTILLGPNAAHQNWAQAMIEAVNATLPDPRDHFEVVLGLIPGSLPHAAEHLRLIPSLVQETTRAGRSLSTRIAQHHVMTSRLLRHVGMLSDQLS